MSTNKLICTSSMLNKKPIQNIDHSVVTGLKHDYGENHAHAKLTNVQAMEARTLWYNGMKQKDIAIKFGVSKQTINNIVHYKTYFK